MHTSGFCRFVTGAAMAGYLSMALLAPARVAGQSREVARGHQVWMQYYGQARLSGRWYWQFDGGFRWKEAFEGKSQYIARTSLLYDPGSSLRFGAGVAHLGFYAGDTLSRVEVRPFQEVQLSTVFEKFALNHRFRLEERQFYPVAGGPGPFAFRLRYSLIASIPLFRLSGRNPVPRFVLEVGDELFLHFGSGGAFRAFDQNRLLISPTLRLSESFSVSLTWNNQYASAPGPSAYTHNQVFWIQARHRLDFRKKAGSPG